VSALAVMMLAGLLGAEAVDPAVTFQKGSQLYLQGDFEGSVQAYQSLCDQGYASPELFYDLGNAHYRAGRVGWAVASWHRALRLAPGDGDARHNIDVARAGVVDRIVGERDEPFFDRLLARISGRAALALFAAPWLLLWVLLSLRRRTFGSARAFLTAGVVAAALLATGTGALLAGKARAERTPLAVVIAKSTPVREGPSAALRAAFELHEGTTVKVVGAEGAFLRVRLPNGLEGWIAKSELAVV
jgi:tetratricopeptide (TPR) repeat protein